MKIKITIVEDHAMFREGIKSILGQIDDFEIIAEYSNGKDFIDSIESIEHDIVLMDIEMPVMGGIEATKIAKRKKSDLKFIALTMYNEPKYYYEMVAVGISGFILKESSVEELEKAIREINSGGIFFSNKLLTNVLASMNMSEKIITKRKVEELNLSEKELIIMKFVCQGCTNSEISETLFLSPKTVESHKTKLMKKTGVKNNAGLIIYAIKNKVIEI